MNSWIFFDVSNCPLGMKIEKKFFDKRTDKSLGLIKYEPFLNAKVADTVK